MDEHLLPRGIRIVAAGIAVVVLACLAVLVMGPARGARADIASQKKLVAAQLASIREQLDLQRKQYALSQRQLTVAQQTLDVAKQSLEVAHASKADIDLQLTISRALQALAREIRAIAQATERHAANLDRKTP